MKTTPMTRSRRAGAAVAIGALAVSGLVFSSPAQAANKVIKSNEVDTSETRATGHNVFLNDGVRVYTEGATSTDKAAAYFDVNMDLADAGEPSMQWSANSGQAGSNVKPSVQLVVDIDGNETPDGILVGEPTYADGSNLYGNVWWLSNGSTPAFKALAPQTGGGYGSTNFGTLDEWRSAIPGADIVKSGWSLGSGVKGDGTINSISVGANDYYFTSGVETTVLYENDVDTSSTRSAGHNTFRPTGGVRTYTDDNTSEGKAAGLFPIDLPLAEVGEPTMEFRTLSGSIPPGLWLNIDADNDGDFDGTLISETAYGNDWWLNETSGIMYENAPLETGGSGSDRHGTLAGWRANFPDAQVMKSGWSLGSGVKGNFIVDAITVGLTKYTFSGANRAPVAEDVSGSGRTDDDIVVELDATDPDGDTLTYTSEEGTVDGSTLTYSSATGGEKTFDYTADDGRGGTDTATVTVTVAANGAPVVEDVDASTVAGQSVDVELNATDPEGDELTYSVDDAEHGTVELTGTTATFTPAFNFAGDGTFTYTVADDRGGSATGTVTVAVAKKESSINYSINPLKRTTKTSLILTATVKAAGAKLKYGIVEIYIDGKLLKRTRVNADGIGSTGLGKLKKGSHDVTTKFIGTGSATGSTKTKTVKVVQG